MELAAVEHLRISLQATPTNMPILDVAGFDGIASAPAPVSPAAEVQGGAAVGPPAANGEPVVVVAAAAPPLLPATEAEPVVVATKVEPVSAVPRAPPEQAVERIVDARLAQGVRQYRVCRRPPTPHDSAPIASN